MAEDEARRERARRALLWAAALISLGAIYGPIYWAHASRAASRWIFNDDARNSIFPFYRYVEPAAWQGDYIGDYALALVPSGTRLLYTASAYVWDPFALSKALPYLLVALTVAGVALAAYRFARAPGAWFAACLVLSSVLYLERTGGGLPRAFAFPIIAWGLAALVHGRIRAALWLTVAGAAFYPSAGISLGAMAAVVLLVLPARDRGEAEGWPAARRLKALALCVGLSAAALAPTWLETRGYGGRITSDMIDEYPEAGPKGTHGSEDRPPYETFLPLFAKEAQRGLIGTGPEWWDWVRERLEPSQGLILDVLLLLSLLGLGLLARERSDARRLWAALAGAFVGHFVARLLAPYMYAPSRMMTYAIPPWIAVVTPLGLGSLLVAWRAPDRWDAKLPEALRSKLTCRNLGPSRAALLTVLAIGIMLAIGGRGHKTKGVHFSISPPHDALYEAMAALPPTARIAGWPDDPVSSIPLVSRRQALMTGEMHLAYHTGYVLQVRARVRAIIGAYLATDLAPIRALREEWGVTHMLVDERHFGSKPPSYMPPFGEEVKALLANRGDRPFLLAKQEGARVHRAGTFVLLDLSRVRGP